MIKFFCAWMCALAWDYSCAQNNTTPPCQCDKDLAFVVQYLEHHYAGFADNVTPANHAAYDSLKNMLQQLVQQPLAETACLAVLKKYLGFFKDNHLQVRSKSFLSFKKTIPWYARPFAYHKNYSQKKVYATPRKVILLYNRRTQSAAEGLILEAMHSNKVLTFGENSGGAITFGDVHLTNTPSGLILQSATQLTTNRFQYERTGIPPQVLADTGSDWIMQACGLWQRISQPRNANGRQTN